MTTDSSIDWSNVFEEAYPVPGATDAILNQFVVEMVAPPTEDEIQSVHAGQRNPFPKSDPLHAKWSPFDAAGWTIPHGPLPTAYLSFLKWSNGGSFRNGERWFQFFPALDPGQGPRAMLMAYELPQYMPGALPFAFNGAGTFYLFDMRQPAATDEYPIVCAHAGYLDWEEDACRAVAPSFLEACRGAIDIDDL